MSDGVMHISEYVCLDVIYKFVTRSSFNTVTAGFSSSVIGSVRAVVTREKTCCICMNGFHRSDRVYCQLKWALPRCFVCPHVISVCSLSLSSFTMFLELGLISFLKRKLQDTPQHIYIYTCI